MGFEEGKFEDVVHYIIHRCGNLDKFGKTVLWKMLYFSDFDYYELYETSITGEEYCKLDKGPAPKHFDTVIEKLKDKGKIKQTKCTFKGYDQIKFVSLKNPDLSRLNAREIKEVDKVISKLSTMNAAQVSALSHEDMPWKTAKDNEVLDYEMVFYRSPLMSVRDYEECPKK
jgi:uncharacterized phage-associated protein